MEWNNPEFQSMTTVFMSMDAKSSDLDDLNSEIKTQPESHTITPSSKQNG